MIRFWLLVACVTVLSIHTSSAEPEPSSSVEDAAVEAQTETSKSPPAPPPSASPEAPETEAQTETSKSPPTPQPRLLLSPLTDNAALGEETMEAWTSTLATELARGGRYRVMTQGDLRALVAAEQMAQLLGGCDGENCAANLARASGADFYVSGQVGLVGTSRVMTLAFLDPRTGEAEARVTRAVPSAQESLALGRIAEELLARAANEPLSELALFTEPPGARVFVNGHEFGTTPLPATTLRPGTHQVVLQKEGYRPLESSLTLEPNEARHRTFSLEPVDEQMKVSDVANVAQEAARAAADAARKAAEADLDAVRRDALEREARRDAEARLAAQESQERAQRLIEEAEERLNAKLAEKDRQKKRRRLGGFALHVGGALLEDTTSQARSTLGGGASGVLLGLSGKIPLFWKLFLGLRVQAMPPFEEGGGSLIDENETIHSSRTAPMGLVELGAGLGVHLPLFGPTFLELAVDAGTRMTDSKRRTETSNDTYDHWYSDEVGVIAGRASFGVGLGVFELAATALVSQPLGAEVSLPVDNPEGSVIGFSTVIQAGVSLGMSF